MMLFVLELMIVDGMHVGYTKVDLKCSCNVIGYINCGVTRGVTPKDFYC